MAILANIAGAIGGQILGRGIGRIADNLFGNPQRRGNKIDDESYRARDQYDWEMARERGLTPQEFYGSPAAGGSAASGGQTLGNNQTAMIQKYQDMQFRAEENQKDRENEIAKAEIHAGASLGSSKISAEASMYAADIQERIAQGKLDLSTKEFNQVTLPGAAAKLKLTKEQTAKAINEVATSAPQFVRSKILLQMGVENTIQTALLQRFGIDITSKADMAKLTTEQFQNVLSVLIASGSATNRELQGLLAGFSSTIQLLGGDNNKFNLNPITPDQKPVDVPAPKARNNRPLDRRTYFNN